MEIGNFDRDNLVIGGFPTITQEINLTGKAEFKRGDVVGKSLDGNIALVDSSKTDGTENVAGIICDDISVLDGETKKVCIYIKGAFSQRHLNFGGSDTVLNHKDYMNKIGLIVKETII